MKKLRNAPSWLGLSRDRTFFVHLPERADVVQQIFQLSIAGFGGYAIAKLLNSKQIPGFGSSKRWDQSTVHNMLTNRATIGEYHRKQKIDGKQQFVGTPVPNYYPAVIDAAVFEAAQIARQKNKAHRSGRRGRVVTNLFFGTTCCFYCFKPVKFSGEKKSLICTAVLSGQDQCPRFAWTYQDFESAIFNKLSSHLPNFSEIHETFRDALEQGDESKILDTRMKMAQFFQSEIKAIVIAMAGVDPPTSMSVTIGRNNPKRFCSVNFNDGSSLKVFPNPSLPSLPEPAGIEISPAILTESFGLSTRQAQIAAFLVQGYSLKQTAEKLAQSHDTARWHLREIFRRTHTRSQFELIQLALKATRMDRAQISDD